MGYIVDSVLNGTCIIRDSLSLSSLKVRSHPYYFWVKHSVVGPSALFNHLLLLYLTCCTFWAQIALAYNEALSNGRLTTSRGEIMQSTFLGSLKKRVEDILNSSTDMNADIRDYALSGKWPTDHSRAMKSSITLSWYLQWYNVPSPLDIRRAAEKIKWVKTSSSVPLLRVVFPTTHVAAIDAINGFLSTSQVKGWSRPNTSCWISSSSLSC